MSATKSATPCPVSREQFLATAKPLTLVINGVPHVADVKEFSTGSLGWYLSGKAVVEVDGVPCKVQLGCTLTVIGSKPQ